MPSKPLQKQQNVKGFKIITHKEQNHVTATQSGTHAAIRRERIKNVKPFKSNHL